MTSPRITGSRVVLRTPRASDKAARREFGRDPEYARMVGEDARPLTDVDVARWYDWLRAQPAAWVIEVDGRMVGDARLGFLNEHDRRARYAVAIFDPTLRGQGIGTEVTRLVLHHAFDTMGLHRVDLRVLAINTRAIAVYERCGFIREGGERESALIDGVWHDDVMMSILEHEYRALRSDH